MVERFSFRWSNYNSSQRLVLIGGNLKRKYFHEHFLRDNHLGLLEDFIKKKLFWMRLLKTLAPSGLNVEKDVGKFDILSFLPC